MDLDDFARDRETAAHRGYPLSALFILVGFCGILSSFVAPAARRYWHGQVDGFTFFGAMLGGAVTLGVLGGLMGLSHHRRVRGFCCGLAVGGLLGLMLGPLVITDSSEAYQKQMLMQSAMTVVGASILVLVGILLRFRSTR